MIVISGCDKTGAAALMPLARTNAFGLVLYPGTSSPGPESLPRESVLPYSPNTEMLLPALSPT